jgi:hypothetical protein
MNKIEKEQFEKVQKELEDLKQVNEDLIFKANQREEKIFTLEEELKAFQISSEKEKVDLKSQSDRWYEQFCNSRDELKDLEATLDVLPEAPPREVHIDRYNKTELSVSARLSCWLGRIAFPNLERPVLKGKDE